MNDSDILVIEGARTPWTEYAGTPGFGLFTDINATQLWAIAAKKALEKSG